MIWFGLWFFLSVGVSFIAGAFNRSRLTWFFVSAVISPILGGALLLAMGNDGKVCPKCAETVKPDALVCKHCNHTFEPVSVNPEVPAKFSAWDS